MAPAHGGSAPLKSLVAISTEKVLLKTSGETFLQGVAFMKAAGLAPDRVSIMKTRSGKFILQFHSLCDVRPFAVSLHIQVVTNTSTTLLGPKRPVPIKNADEANYQLFSRVLRGLVHLRAWKIRSIEFINVPFHSVDIPQLQRSIEKIEVELVLLKNCTYPGIAVGAEALRFFQALNRGRNAMVCEYGDDRLKSRIRCEDQAAVERAPPAQLFQQNQNPPNVIVDGVHLLDDSPNSGGSDRDEDPEPF